MKLVIINACVRQGESRTLRIAEQDMDYSTPGQIETKISACVAEGLELEKDW